MHSFYQTIPSFSSFPYKQPCKCSLCVIVSCTCHYLCCVVCCCVLCSFPLEADWDIPISTMHHLNFPIQHAPTSCTNVTHICRHLRLPLYILLALVGIPTNYLVIIVVNIIAETLHRQNREGLFQLGRQFFNKNKYI